MKQSPPPRYMRFEDVISGLAIVAVGAFGLWVARTYPVGTLSSMGPGWFPRAICIVVVVLGLAIVAANLFKALDVPAEPQTLRLRPLAMVVASFLAFALLLKVVGLLPAILALILIAAFAVPRRSLGELALIVFALEGMTLALWSVVKLSVPLIGAN